MTEKLILGLDIGTSSVRAAMYDGRGDVLSETLIKTERRLEETIDGGSEIDVEVAFKQVVKTIDGVLEKSAGVKGEIEYVASCSFWHSLVGVDKTGKPTTKVFGWADTRSRECTSVLRKRFDEAELHNRTGARFHSSFWPAKLLWLRKDFSDAFARTAHWLSFSDFVALKLFGKAVTSVSMASGTGMFNQRECKWDSELAKCLKVKTVDLPRIADASETFQLKGPFAKRWPQLKNAKWFSAMADGAANNIGAGCVKKSKAALMIGTSGAMRIAYRGEPPPEIPSGLWSYRIDRKRVIIGGALSDGGGLYRWLRENLRLPDDDRIQSEIARREPAGHGLTFLPFLAGERGTGYNESAHGALIGITSSTDAIDIAQAALESVAYRFAEIFEQLTTVSTIKEVIASGGALRASPAWTQILADVLGRDLTLVGPGEPSMRGAVLLALETAGRIKKIEDVPAPGGKQFAANRSRKAVYAAARKLHQNAYKFLIDREK